MRDYLLAANDWDAACSAYADEQANKRGEQIIDAPLEQEHQDQLMALHAG